MTVAEKFEALTNENDHTGATIALADAIGGYLADAYKVVLEEISLRHELAGSIDANDQKIRDGIQSDLYKTAKLMGLV